MGGSAHTFKLIDDEGSLVQRVFSRERERETPISDNPKQTFLETDLIKQNQIGYC